MNWLYLGLTGLLAGIEQHADQGKVVEPLRSARVKALDAAVVVDDALPAQITLASQPWGPGSGWLHLSATVLVARVTNCSGDIG